MHGFLTLKAPAAENIAATNKYPKLVPFQISPVIIAFGWERKLKLRSLVPHLHQMDNINYTFCTTAVLCRHPDLLSQYSRTTIVTKNTCAIFLAPLCSVGTLQQLISRGVESAIGWAWVVFARKFSCNTFKTLLSVIFLWCRCCKSIIQYCLIPRRNDVQVRIMAV